MDRKPLKPARKCSIHKHEHGFNMQGRSFFSIRTKRTPDYPKAPMIPKKALSKVKHVQSNRSFSREDILNSTWKLTNEDWVPLHSKGSLEFPNKLFSHPVKTSGEPETARGVSRTRRKHCISDHKKPLENLKAIYLASPNVGLIKKVK